MKRYKLSYGLLALLVLIGSSFAWSNVPTRGYLAGAEVQPGLRFSYLPAALALAPAEAAAWRRSNPEAESFAAPEHALRSMLGSTIPTPRMFPVADVEASGRAGFASAFTMVPSDMLPGFGRTVYAIDMVDARLVFLHANADKADLARQLTWLEAERARAEQRLFLVFMQDGFRDAESWQRIARSGVAAVVTEQGVYVQLESLEQLPADLEPIEGGKWGRWSMPHRPEEPYGIVLRADKERLVAAATNRKGVALDQLVVDRKRTRQAALREERTLIGIQSLWRYRSGAEGIEERVQPGFDVTGEHPSVGELKAVPPSDWRSPSFDDRDWRSGRGPLGHSARNQERRMLRTVLPVDSSTASAYFRRTFELNEDPEKFDSLELHILYEDGFSMYMNGYEIARDGIRTGLLKPHLLAEPGELHLYQLVDMNDHVDKLRRGTNTVAVEVHRSHPKSGNLMFDLQLTAGTGKKGTP